MWGDAEQEPRRGLEGRGSAGKAPYVGLDRAARSSPLGPSCWPPLGLEAALSKETRWERDLSAVTAGNWMIFTSAEKALATPE